MIDLLLVYNNVPYRRGGSISKVVCQVVWAKKIITAENGGPEVLTRKICVHRRCGLVHFKNAINLNVLQFDNEL